MKRMIEVILVLGVWMAAGTAAAQGVSGEFNAEAEPMASDSSDDSSDEFRAELDALRAEVEALKKQNKMQEESGSDASEKKSDSKASDDSSKAGKKLEGILGGWEIGTSGYFRAPLTLGISNRPNPDDMDGEAQTQITHGPNRLMDANYYSFAYTRIQEQDWAQLSIYARKKHVEAEIGWMGYWLQSAGYRIPDAGWAPGIARLTLDTDFNLGKIKPNIALTGGAFWPKFGYHEKYDTFTLGQYRHLGEQLRLTIPFGESGARLVLYQGFGTGRDGSYNYTIGDAPKIYGAETGINLLHYEHVRFEYKDLVSAGFHFSKQFTRDATLYPADVGQKTYTHVRDAQLGVLGGEITVDAPRAGHFWLSPSYVRVKNGWALAENGTEVMHGLGGAGIATNYMAFNGSVGSSPGTGEMFNLGFQWEDSLSTILGKKRGEMIPDVTLGFFGLMAQSWIKLPSDSSVSQYRLKEFKWGADIELHAPEWLGVMLRYDSVNLDLDHPAYVMSSITARLTFSSHFLSGERIYIQYSHYKYGDNMTIAGKWPWGQPLVAGSDIVQSGPYSGWEPDRDVLKIQAEISF